MTESIVWHQLVGLVHPSHVRAVPVYHCWLLNFLHATWSKTASPPFGHHWVIMDGAQHQNIPLVLPLQCKHSLLHFDASHLTLLQLGFCHTLGHSSPVWTNCSTSSKSQLSERGEKCWTGVVVVTVQVVSLLLQSLDQLQHNRVSYTITLIKCGILSCR